MRDAVGECGGGRGSLQPTGQAGVGSWGALRCSSQRAGSESQPLAPTEKASYTVSQVCAPGRRGWSRSSNHTNTSRLSVPNGHATAHSFGYSPSSFLFFFFFPLLFFLASNTLGPRPTANTTTQDSSFPCVSVLFIAGRRSIARPSAPGHNAVDVGPVGLVAGHAGPGRD